jgi:hypothetical protein
MVEVRTRVFNVSISTFIPHISGTAVDGHTAPSRASSRHGVVVLWYCGIVVLWYCGVEVLLQEQLCCPLCAGQV